MSPCRSCGASLEHTFVDLGKSPLANSYLEAHQLFEMEAFYPLHVYVCGTCFLVQLEPVVSPEQIFRDYAYFSSYSTSWLHHARRYAEMMIERFGFDASSQIIEIASNDGYLLQYFRERGLAVLGIEPASKVAEVARERGIATLECFFNAKTAGQLVAEGKRADLLLGNNVLAHVPELWDFISGMKLLLAPEGIITMEFPHLMRLMESNQFDTIYHEHLSYFSFRVVNDLFERQGLRIFDVEELPTHGGSLRIFARHPEHEAQAVTERVEALLSREEAGGLGKLSHYLSFAPRVEATKRKLLRFLLEAKDQGKAVVGYAAAAKGNTLLNYCGIRTDMLDYVVDRSPHKQGRWLPGTHVPITGPERILETKPDYVLILAWNLKNEIMEDLRFIREWGGRFAFPIPRLEVIE